MAKEPQMQITDEILMALADGELPPDQAGQVVAAVDADPELQARLRLFTETRRLLREDAAEVPAPADEALIAQIRAAAAPQSPAATIPAAPVAPAAPQPANLNRRPLAAIAAALAAVVVGIGIWTQTGGPDAALPDAQIAALDSLPSGEVGDLPDGQSLSMIASYRGEGGEFCREYETHAGTLMQLVIACRTTDGWEPRFAAELRAADGYVPASGEIEALDEFIASAGLGEPLTPEDEAAALAK